VAELLFYRAMEARLKSSHYPLEELNDHLRAGSSTQIVDNTLAYFDPARHAPAVTAQTMLAVDDPDWCTSLIDALPAAEFYKLTHRDGTDNNYLDAWLANLSGVRPMSRFVA
jgi:hypothetical protein